MALRLRYSWLIALLLFALPVQAASSPSNLVIVDPTQRDLFDQLFLEAKGPQKSFARDLLPGRGDNHLSWFPQQFLVPLANGNATPGAPLPGYLIGLDGSVSPVPMTLGLAQGGGIAGAALSPTGNACYLADGSSNNLAAYQVDVQTSLFSNVAGAPFATDSNPNGVVVEPSGRFLYAVNGGGQSVTIYSINLATQVLTKIGTMPTSVTSPQAINATRQCVFVTSLASGGYEVFALNGSTGALGSVPGSPFGAQVSSSAARTPDGNFVYFSQAFSGEIDGFFIDDATCALTPVPGSPFTGPVRGVLRANADVPALYSAGSGSLQAYSIDPATGALSPLGAAVPIDPDTGALVVGPKGLTLWTSDLANHNLRSFSLDAVTGAVKTGTAPVAGPRNVDSMVLLSPNGGSLIGQGIAQNRSQRTLGGAPPYTYALIGGALPAGLSIDATGKITGTPTTLGQSTFDLLVTDAVGATTSGLRTLKVVVPPAAPAAPSNLTASVVSSSQARLNWQDNAGQTAAFQVELSQDGGPYLFVQSVRPQTTTALINSLSPDTSYTFRVRAVNAAGGALDTTTATVTTPALAPAACTASANGQCLLGGRFLVEALYQDSHGNAGLANVVPITTDTAYLWFFSSTNVEVVVKLVDGCGLGNHFWVFAGGLTNVHVILRVTDTSTGAVRYYEVPFGPPFTPIQDTNAFGTCSARAAANADAAAATALRQSAVADVDSHLARLSALAGERLAGEQPDASPGSCTTTATTMCLNNGRFKVQATFNAGASGSGNAQAVGLTPDTGYLWFFSSSNVEAIVKVLNGCGLNGHYWVFAGGLTNVQVTLTVTDTQTGLSQVYNNPPNTTYQPIQDTSAFSTCP